MTDGSKSGLALKGPMVTLTPFGERHITPRYLAWLSDDEVNRYSKRYGSPPQSAADARAWLAGISPDEHVLAIEAAGLGHVGNIKLGPIHHRDGRADISILIGERAVWGRGIGAEATYLATRHLFSGLGLNRVEAGSANPAFIRMVEKLGWKKEGLQRQRVRIGGHVFDWTLVAQLRSEFRTIDAFEPAEASAGVSR